MPTTYFIDDDANLLTEEEATAAGYKQDPSCSEGFWSRDTGYCERVDQIKVCSRAVDGARRPRVFRTYEGAAKYIRSEGWAETNVSDDGITILSSIEFKCGSSGWRSCPPLSRKIRQMAQACATPTLYADVKDGDYFTITSPHGTPVAFKQDSADEHWRMYLTPGAKAVERPRPTRLWDGSFLAIDDDRPVAIVTKEEAKKLSDDYRRHVRISS